MRDEVLTPQDKASAQEDFQPDAQQLRPFPYLKDFRPSTSAHCHSSDSSDYQERASETERAKAAEILASSCPMSLHDHPVVLPDPINRATLSAWERKGREELCYPGLLRSKLAGVFACAMSLDDLFAAVRWASLLRADLAHQSVVSLAESHSDLRMNRAGAPKPLSIFLSVEGLSMIFADLAGIEILYGSGIRCAGITYNHRNSLGSGLREANDEGLTKFGKSAISLMNELGMIVDIAHAGDRTSLDVCAHSRTPVVISHAGARALCNSSRMKPDDVIKACAATGGLIGIEAAPGTTRVDGAMQHDIDSVMQHLAYAAELVGSDHVALGPDTFFGDHVGFHGAFGYRGGTGAASRPESAVFGMDNPGECVRNATLWLVQHGYSESDISKIIGGNVVRLIEKVIP